MERQYDFVYLTNTPSFYKLNLCNKIAKNHKLLLVLYGYGSEAVNKELKASSNFNFDYYFLNEGDSNTRNKLQTFCNLLKLMKSIKCRKIIYAGWLAPEYNIYSFLSPKKRNAIVCESSILDVSLNGISGWIKRKIISRMSATLPSGKPHAQLFESIGFDGKQYITGSVGIFNKPTRKHKEINIPLRYIYVGRLIKVKNVDLLIRIFNQNGKPLTIVGQGVLEEHLKRQAKANISFSGFVNNEKLGDIYQQHDILILPSTYEPWGLVVEEAIYWGLPVIVSNKVGCSIDMVKEFDTGEIFKLEEKDGLLNAIKKIELNYSFYKKKVLQVDWEERDRKQINSYISLLD